jgi:6-phosphofructokinase 1
MGFAGGEDLMAGRKSEMVNIINRDIAYTPFAQAVKHIEDLNPQVLRVVDILTF